MKKIVLLILMTWSIGVISQEKLEIVGKVKITEMDPSNSDSIVVWNSDGTLGRREAPSLPIAGTMAGEMLYWNGTAWITVSAGKAGEILRYVKGVPTWTPEVGPTDVLNPITGKVWMDRNLGASRVATDSADYLAYGDLYQWGRGSDGHEKITWTSSTMSDGAEQANETSTQSNMDLPGHGEFILAPSSPYDWRSPQNDALWQGVGGTNNPCPTGYRIPTETEWNAERSSWSSNNSAGAFASPLKLPVAGRRISNDGTLVDVGSYGNYWSSTVSATYSRRLFFSSGIAIMSTNYRADGFSVRCIKD